MALLLPVNDPSREVLPAKNGVFTLEEMQALVGGYIEFIYPATEVLIFDEDGKRKNLPMNYAATRVARLAGIMPWDYVVGPAVLATRKEAGFCGSDDVQ